MLDWVVLAMILGQSYGDSLDLFQLGFSAAGAGLMMMGAGLAVVKPKPTDKPTSPAVKWTGVGLLLLSGIGTIIFAWVGF